MEKAIPCWTIMKICKLQYLLSPTYHYKAENLNFSKVHEKALMFKVSKKILTEFTSKLHFFPSISGNFGDQSYL